MAVQTPMDLFVYMLSDVRQRTEKSKEFFTEVSQAAEDADIKQAIDAHTYVQGNVIGTIDHIFDIIGKKPVSTESKFRETFKEDFRKELALIEAPAVKRLYVASMINQLMRLHAAEYAILTEMADITGNYGVGALLETCLADSLTFADRLRDRVRDYVETAVPMRKAA